MYCSVLQCGAVCFRVVQCVAGWCSVLQCVAGCCRVVQCVAVYSHAQVWSANSDGKISVQNVKYKCMTLARRFLFLMGTAALYRVCSTGLR